MSCTMRPEIIITSENSSIYDNYIIIKCMTHITAIVEPCMHDGLVIPAQVLNQLAF